MNRSSNGQEEQAQPGKLEQFLRSLQGQMLVRLLATVLTVLIEHYLKW